MKCWFNSVGASASAKARIAMLKIIKFVLYDILRNKIILGYTFFLLAIGFGLFNLSDDPAKGVVSLLNLALIVAPLVSAVFTAVYFYNAYEFTELLAAQPLQRSAILLSQFMGVTIALGAAACLGLGLPIALFSPNASGWAILLVTILLSIVFVALSLLASVFTRDKARGIGIALLAWFYFALLYDALVLMLMFSFSDYPLEKAMVVMAALNPVDMARIAVLLQLDYAALMGYTGALFREFLGAWTGIALAVLAQLLWIVLPLMAALRIFRYKDL